MIKPLKTQQGKRVSMSELDAMLTTFGVKPHERCTLSNAEVIAELLILGATDEQVERFVMQGKIREAKQAIYLLANKLGVDIVIESIIARNK